MVEKFGFVQNNYEFPCIIQIYFVYLRSKRERVKPIKFKIMSKKTFWQNIENVLEREFNPNETLQWLKQNQSIYWSWGVSKLFQYKNKSLFLKVNGFEFKGWVLITLGWNDTYTVRFLNGQYREISKTTDVYVDMLRDFIDEKIEKQKSYSF